MVLQLVIGLSLVAAAMVWLACMLWRTHGIKIDLDDQIIIWAVVTTRMRNVSIFFMLCAFAAYFLWTYSLSLLPIGSPEYVARDASRATALQVGVALSILASVLAFKSRKFDFKKMGRRYAERHLAFKRRIAQKSQRLRKRGFRRNTHV